MSKLYSTGEVASILGVTVRAVQHYDNKKLVCPSQISEGGRRLYSDEDVMKLKVVCFLRDIDFSINTIKEFLKEENSPKVMEMLIDEQKCELETELNEIQKKLAVLEDVRKVVKEDKFIVENIAKIDKTDMENKKNLRKMRTIILVVAIIAELIEDGLIALGIIFGLWWVIVVGALSAVANAVWISVYYAKRVAYKCPECDHVFVPKFWDMFFANHTMKTRKLVCPNCGKKSWCVEVYKNPNNNEEVDKTNGKQEETC